MHSIQGRLFPALAAVLAIFSLASCGGAASAPSNSATSTSASSGTSSSGTSGTSSATNAAVPQLGHIAIVMLENQNYSDVIGSSSMPYLNKLAQQGGLATNYYADAHPSLPNYFAITTGQTITLNDYYSGTVNVDNAARELDAAGKTWKVYADAIPHVGYLGGDEPPYIQHHNPFTYFTDVVNSSTLQMNIVPFSQLASDMASASLPQYLFIVPSNIHNTHDCPTSAACTNADRLAACDQWLSANLAPLLSNSQFATDGVLIITFDESATDGTNGGGHVAMVLAGAKVKAGYKSTQLYQHDNVLRLSLEALGVNTFPGKAASATSMGEFFQ